MKIHSLIKEFCALDKANVGRGPRHPTNPEPRLAKAVESFLEQYPFLRHDSGYVEFLECYAGAYLAWPNDELLIDIYGFSDVSTLITGDDGPVVDEEGYLTFCSALFRVQEGPGLENIQTLGLAFDASQERKPGVYLQVVGREPGSPVTTHWYCETFLESFHDLIHKRGRLT